MVILRFRVPLCCILGSILSCIFGFYSGLPPSVPLVPVFTGPPNYGNPGFFVAQIVFSSTTTVGFWLAYTLCKPLNHFTTVPTNSVPSTAFILKWVNHGRQSSFVLFLFCLCISNKYPTRSPCLLYTSPSPRDRTRSRMPSSA